MSAENETEKGGMSAPERSKDNLDARIMAIYGVLNTPNLNSTTHPETLRKTWVEQLKENLEQAVANTLRNEGEQTVAKVFQHGDANLANLDHATFVNAFLVAFGATATINGRREGVGSMNFQSVVSRAPRAAYEDTWNIDLKPHVSRNADGTADDTIMLDTKIPGVKLLFDGKAISHPDHIPSVRAMIALDTRGSGDEGDVEQIES